MFNTRESSLVDNIALCHQLVLAEVVEDYGCAMLIERMDRIGKERGQSRCPK